MAKIDAIESFVQFLNETKPYHTKLLEVVLEYVYQEAVDVAISERVNFTVGYDNSQALQYDREGYGLPLWGRLNQSNTSSNLPFNPLYDPQSLNYVPQLDRNNELFDPTWGETNTPTQAQLDASLVYAQFIEAVIESNWDNSQQNSDQYDEHDVVINLIETLNLATTYTCTYQEDFYRPYDVIGAFDYCLANSVATRSEEVISPQTHVVSAVNYIVSKDQPNACGEPTTSPQTWAPYVDFFIDRIDVALSQVSIGVMAVDPNWNSLPFVPPLENSNLVGTLPNQYGYRADGFGLNDLTVNTPITFVGTYTTDDRIRVQIDFDNDVVNFFKFSGLTPQLMGSIALTDPSLQYTFAISIPASANNSRISIVTNEFGVTPPPALITATVNSNGESVDVTFDGELCGDPVEGFTFNGLTILSSELQNNNINHITDVVYYDDIVKMSYNDTVGRLRGIGGFVQSFGPLQLINNSIRRRFAIINAYTDTTGTELTLELNDTPSVIGGTILDAFTLKVEGEEETIVSGIISGNNIIFTTPKIYQGDIVTIAYDFFAGNIYSPTMEMLDGVIDMPVTNNAIDTWTPSYLPGILDWGIWNDVSRLKQTSLGTGVVSNDFDEVRYWRGQLDTMELSLPPTSNSGRYNAARGIEQFPRNASYVNQTVFRYPYSRASNLPVALAFVFDTTTNALAGALSVSGSGGTRNGVGIYNDTSQNPFPLVEGLYFYNNDLANSPANKIDERVEVNNPGADILKISFSVANGEAIGTYNDTEYTIPRGPNIQPYNLFFFGPEDYTVPAPGHQVFVRFWMLAEQVLTVRERARLSKFMNVL